MQRQEKVGVYPFYLFIYLVMYLFERECAHEEKWGQKDREKQTSH